MATIPGTISADLAARKLTEDQAAEQWRHCAKHQVTTCPTCNGLFRLDQTRLAYVGYYVQPEAEERAREAAKRGDQEPLATQIGARYSRVCPNCRTDLTDLITLHFEACRLTLSHP